MTYLHSTWTNALADLKDAAHDGGVTVEETDRWAVSHTANGGTLGRYTDAGGFEAIANVSDPHALRDLRHLYA